ncbi:MAG: CDP-alcohol phosphatidyltransferase family protein [Deltaproteobacteria bacterium]|nr:CDP-alcohol phosphatidyltransferase family protein [Deltaproteobacteria bacterium]
MIKHLPNFITISRLLAIPFIAYFFSRGQYEQSLMILIYAGLSDLIDGGLARALSSRTKLGAILDPAADKLLMFVGYFTLAFAHVIPFWVAFLVFLRDLYIVLGVLFLKTRHKRIFIRPTYLSKMTTFFQLFLLSFGFLSTYLPVARWDWLKNLSEEAHLAFQINLFLMILFTALSAIHYTFIGIAILKNSDESEA